MKKSKEARERRNKIIIGFVVVIFIASSIAGVVLYRNDGNVNAQTLNLGGKEYALEQKIDSFGNPYYFLSEKTDHFYVYYLPSQLSYLMDNETQNYMKSINYFYLAFNPNEVGVQMTDYIRFDLRQNLPTTVYFADAVTEESEKYPLPVVTCSNASAGSPVVLLQSANNTNISMHNNCIVMEYAQYDVLRIRDTFAYLTRGIGLK